MQEQAQLVPGVSGILATQTHHQLKMQSLWMSLLLSLLCSYATELVIVCGFYKIQHGG
jgi:hypothetical protein